METLLILDGDILGSRCFIKRWFGGGVGSFGSTGRGATGGNGLSFSITGSSIAVGGGGGEGTGGAGGAGGGGNSNSTMNDTGPK